MRVVELAGGVGGAKLAEGLAAHLGTDLTVVVNTGDDLELHGLSIWPDHDTVAYTLAGLDDEVRGWGLRDETWTVMEGLWALGDASWFRLGDRDIATHLWRTDRLRTGTRPTDVALELGAALRIGSTILPMSDEQVRTEVLTDDGWLEFQEYFVHRHQEPEVREVRFRGIEAARPTPEVLAAIDAADVIVIAPSNPVVSIGPILAVPGMASALAAARDRGVPVVAVSGIIGGKALKGPADRMLASFGHESSALGVARLYAGLATAFVIDAADADATSSIARLGLRAGRADTIMTDDAARAGSAGEVLRAARRDRGMNPDVPARVVYAVIPVGALDGAKSRLGAVLDAEERHDLALRLADATIRSAVATPGIAETLVITPDDEVRAVAMAAGARPVLQRSRGLNAGLREARAEALAAWRHRHADPAHRPAAGLPCRARRPARNMGDGDGAGAPARCARAGPSRTRHQRAVACPARRDRRLFRRRQPCRTRRRGRGRRRPVHRSRRSVDLRPRHPRRPARSTRRRPRSRSVAERIEAIAIDGLGEIVPGDDLPSLIADAVAAASDILPLRDDDALVVTQKIVSKAEGAVVDLTTIEPSPVAQEFAGAHDRDPRQVEVVLREAKRVVRMANGVIITETHHGFVCANGGIDASNVGPGVRVDRDAAPERPRCLGGPDPRRPPRAARAGRAGRRVGQLRAAVAPGHRRCRDRRVGPAATRRPARQARRRWPGHAVDGPRRRRRAGLGRGARPGQDRSPPARTGSRRIVLRGEGRIADALLPAEMDLFR